MSSLSHGPTLSPTQHNGADKCSLCHRCLSLAIIQETGWNYPYFWHKFRNPRVVAIWLFYYWVISLRMLAQQKFNTASIIVKCMDLCFVRFLLIPIINFQPLPIKSGGCVCSLNAGLQEQIQPLFLFGLYYFWGTKTYFFITMFGCLYLFYDNANLSHPLSKYKKMLKACTSSLLEIHQNSHLQNFSGKPGWEEKCVLF